MADGYAINVTRPAHRELGNLSRDTLNRVAQKIDALANEPRPPGCRKLVGQENLWRIRVGDYRVLYSIDDSARLIEIIAVRHRSKAYE
jgi:mRNA interferase RelE/StbE